MKWTRTSMQLITRLLIEQGYRCFFCGHPIPEGEESVEHLVPVSKGGPTEDENCVACCQAFNSTLGSLSYKQKLRMILDSRSDFRCPLPPPPPEKVPVLPTPEEIAQIKYDYVLSQLSKRQSHLPYKLPALRNVIIACFDGKIADDDVEAIIERLQTDGHLSIENENLTFTLPRRGRNK